MKKRFFYVALALAVTGLGLSLAFKNIHWGEVRDVLSRARWGWIPIMVAISCVDLAIRAARWRILLSPVADAPWGLLARLEAIGLGVNNLIFMRVGEFLRAVLAGRKLGLPAATALSSVVVERFMDVAALLALFSAAGWWEPGMVEAPVRAAAHAALGGILTVLGLIVFARSWFEPEGVIGRRLAVWPKARDLARHLVSGGAALRRPAAALSATALSLMLWSVDAVGLWAAARALGMGELVGPARAILVLSWAGAGAALPAAPGAIGTFEAAVRTILERFGAQPAEALAYAVLSHMVGFLFITVLGVTFLWREGLTLGAVESQGEDSGDPP